MLAGCGPVVTGLGPPVAVAGLASEGFVTRDGTVLPLRRWLPDGAPTVAAIVALHGFNDYGNAFAGPGAFWAAWGIAVYAPDQRGFGATATKGYWAGHEALTADAADLVATVARALPGRPVFLLGESMGGAVAIETAVHHPEAPLAGLILVAPAVWGEEDLPVFGQILLDLFTFLMPWNYLTAPEGLRLRPSDNTAMLRAFGKDPLVIKRTRFDALSGLVELMDLAKRDATGIAVQTLLARGERDQLVPKAATRTVADRLAKAAPGFRDLDYPDGYHMLLRDLAGERVWRDIGAWVLHRHMLAAGK